MHGAKVLFLVVAAGLAVATGVFSFVPSTRPAMVKKWFQKASGFTPATSAEDALDRFKRAIEKRDYEAAALYVTADYKEWLDKAGTDAAELARAIDDLRAVMKNHGVKSDKADFVLFMLDPFPTNFKVADVRKSADNTAVATLDWSEELARHQGQGFHGWQIDNRVFHSLLPRVALARVLPVSLKQESDGAWRIVFPVQIADRHLRDTAEYLRKNGSNFRNALVSLKTDVKNNPTTKENFEGSLKTNLEQSK